MIEGVFLCYRKRFMHAQHVQGTGILSGRSGSVYKFNNSEKQCINMLSFYKKLSVAVFGGFVDRYIDAFKPLKSYIIGSNIGILLKTWACLILFSTLVSYFVSIATVWLFVFILGIDFVASVYYLMFIPILTASFVLLILYVYPIQRTNSIKNSIDTDLPFAVSHMSAIVSSGIPPEFMFELLINFKEYRYISEHAKTIVRNIKTFGMSSTSAIANVAQRTPSSAFKQILDGIVSTIEKGGNIVEYLEGMAETALFEYRIKRENYLKILSTYADIYTALLVAAPLMMLAVLGIMNIIGGEVFGLSIQETIWLITWMGLPLLNTGFLLFIHMTYPGV